MVGRLRPVRPMWFRVGDVVAVHIRIGIFYFDTFSPQRYADGASMHSVVKSAFR